MTRRDIPTLAGGEMRRICPNPMAWHDVFERLTNFARSHACRPELPPKPLILAGWAHTNDVEKLRRWEETVAWASDNGCTEAVRSIPDEDFYYVSEPTTHNVGSLGGPMYRPWDFDCKGRPPPDEIARHLETLKSRWSEIVSSELAPCTRPLAFTGVKARRLLVRAVSSYRPPWGGWSHLSSIQAERRAFTRFRERINNAIAPHEVDHIDFTTDAEPAARMDAPQAARPRALKSAIKEKLANAEKAIKLPPVVRKGKRAMAEKTKAKPASSGAVDNQIIELLGRNRLLNELLLDGLEVALPVRDRGVDLIAYIDLESKVTSFVACPIQMKAASTQAFSIDRKYAKISNLILAYVWGLRVPEEAETFALTYREALSIADAMGWTKTESWKKGTYSTSSPSKKLRELLQPYKMSTGAWRSKILDGNDKAL